MGRGGLMVGDNETIKGENGQIVRGGGLSASEGGSGGREEGVRGFVRMSIVIFSSFLSYQSWLARAVKSGEVCFIKTQ